MTRRRHGLRISIPDLDRFGKRLDARLSRLHGKCSPEEIAVLRSRALWNFVRRKTALHPRARV